MWFGKAVQDFNDFIVAQGHNGPNLVANLGNGFTSKFAFYDIGCDFNVVPVVWVAYAFYAVPLVISLAKLNIKSTKA